MVPGTVAPSTSRITTEVIDAAAKRQLVLHAAGVADEHGRVIALVGGTGSGKTTLARRLTQKAFGYVTDKAFGYVTDEAVSCTTTGAIVVFPRPLTWAQPDPGHDAAAPISPDELDLRPCGADLELARIILLDRHDEAASPTLTDVGLLDAVLELIPRIPALTRRANPLQKLCQLVDRCGGIARLTYREADQTGGIIQELLDTPTAPTERWAPLSEPSSYSCHLMDGRVRRGRRRDAIETDEGEALLLIDRTPVRLSRIGLTIWLEARDAPKPAELVARVLAEHGPHPDAEAIVLDAIASMVEAGVLGLDQPRRLEDHLQPRRETMRTEPPGPDPSHRSADGTV